MSDMCFKFCEIIRFFDKITLKNSKSAKNTPIFYHKLPRNHNLFNYEQYQNDKSYAGICCDQNGKFWLVF